MKKSKQWIADFKSNEEFAKEYAEETAKLVAERTAKSLPETKLGAMDGAIRQQKDKFRSICYSIKELSESMFDTLVDSAVPEYKQLKLAAIKQKTEPKKDNDVEEYRKSKRR